MIGQREDLLRDAIKEHARIALLEVGSAAAVYQQRVTGEHHARAIVHVRHTA